MTEKEIPPVTGMQDYLAMILRRRVLFIAICVTAFIVAIIVSFIMPRAFEATSFVRVNANKMIDPLVRGGQTDNEPADVKVEFDTLSKQIMTWPRLEQLVAQLHMADNIKSPAELEEFIKILQKNISVKMKNKDIVEISYRDKNPAICQQVVNTLTQNFIDENTRINKEEASNTIDFISEQLKIYRKKLGSSQENVLFSKIDSDLRIALNRKILLMQRMEKLQRQVVSEQNPVISQLQSRLGQLETELARLMLDAREGNPRVAEIRKEIAVVKERVDSEMQKDNGKDNRSAFNPLYLQAEQELRQVEMDISDLQRRKKDIETASVKGAKKQVSDEEVSTLERNKQVDEDIYQMLLRQLEAAYVSERLQDSEKGNRFSIIEYARLPLKPVSPKIGRIIGMGFCGGILLAFGIVFLVETVLQSFQTVEEAEKALGLPALGSISRIILEKDIPRTSYAQFKEKFNTYIDKYQTISKMRFVAPHIARVIKNVNISSKAVVYHDPRSSVAEEFRVLRTTISHGIQNRTSLKVILMTSSLRGEGKSTTSANLAIAMADSGLNVLLVDCDLRRGSTHEIFSLPLASGVSDIVQGTLDLGSVVFKTPIKNLSVITSGRRPHQPSELLGSAPMRELVRQLRAQYDLVLLDAPPVLNLPDPRILSKYADGVIMVVQSGRTRRLDVVKAKTIMEQVEAPMVGVVLTNVQYHVPRYMYDYYYETES